RIRCSTDERCPAAASPLKCTGKSLTRYSWGRPILEPIESPHRAEAEAPQNRECAQAIRARAPLVEIRGPPARSFFSRDARAHSRFQRNADGLCRTSLERDPIQVALLETRFARP